MAKPPQRSSVATTDVVAASARATAPAWDGSEELSFDFTTPGAENGKPGLKWGTKDRAGVKEAIIRWLEEQL